MVNNSKGRQVQVMGYYSAAKAKQLRDLSEATGVPQAALLRQALDDLLKKRGGGVKSPRRSDDDTAACLAQVFSDIELLVAADVIKSALAEGRRHLDPEALNRVLGRLTMAYKRKSRRAASE